MKSGLLKQALIAAGLVIGVPLAVLPLFARGFRRADDWLAVWVLLVVVLGVPLLFAHLGSKGFWQLVSLNLLIAAFAVLSNLAFAYRPDVLSQVAIIFLSLYWLVLLVINIVGAFRFGSLVPPALSVLTVILVVNANHFGHRLRLYVFERRLGEYEEAVEIVKGRVTEGPVHLLGNEVPHEFQHLGHGIFAEPVGQDGVAVTFLWGGGFPVKHAAFVYTSDGNVPNRDAHGGWPHASRINEHWFKVGD